MADMKAPKELALDFVCQRFRESTELVPVPVPPKTVYNFDPKNWDLFVVSTKSRSGYVGGDEYVAVNRSTGEVRDLGRLGQ